MSGDSPLHAAVLANEPKRLRRLLQEKGNAPHSPLYTPLQLALLLGHSACERVLSRAREPCIKFAESRDAQPRLVTPAQFEQKTHVAYLPHLRASSLKVFAHALRICRRGRRRFINTERLWLEALYREDIQRGATADVSVRWIDEEIGYGVFAESPIPPKAFIGAYTGHLTFRPLVRFVLNEYRFFYETCGWTLRALTVDAKSGGNITRFVNHSDDPNCEAIYLPYGGIVQIVFRSKRLIEKGEQLSIDYGTDFWEAHTIPKLSLDN